MEILILAAVVLALIVTAALVGTAGHPLRLFSAFGESLGGIWANRWPLLWIAAGVFLVLGFLYFYYASPGTRIGPEQPIAFSHRLHAGDKAISCRFCHPYVERSNHPGIPAVEKCLYCHNHIIANHPEILKEHAYYNTDTPTPWVKVFYMPEHVLFNHQRHLLSGIDCAACHGEVQQMDRLQDRRLKMGFCIDCHREKNATLDCWLSCHS
jgi:hypothetical protein